MPLLLYEHQLIKTIIKEIHKMYYKLGVYLCRLQLLLHDLHHEQYKI